MAKKDLIWAGIKEYEAEIGNIRYFLREKRTIIEWQDWLRVRVPKLKAVTAKVSPTTRKLGQGWNAQASRYTDLLTYLCMLGSVIRDHAPDGMRTYVWANLDNGE